MSIPYFLVGYFIGKRQDIIKSYGKLAIIGVVSALIVYLILIYNGAAQMNGPSFGKNIILNYLAGLSGTVFVFVLSMILANMFKSKIYVRTISRNTLFIIFSHWVLLAPCSIIIKNVLAKVSDNSFYILVVSIIVSTTVLQLSKVMIEYGLRGFPVLFGKYKYLDKIKI